MGLNALAASGNTVAAGSEGCVYFWDWRSNEQLACFDDTHPEAVTQASNVFTRVAPRGVVLLTASHEWCFRLGRHFLVGSGVRA